MMINYCMIYATARTCLQEPFLYLYACMILHPVLTFDIHSNHPLLFHSLGTEYYKSKLPLESIDVLLWSHGSTFSVLLPTLSTFPSVLQIYLNSSTDSAHNYVNSNACR